MSFVSVSQSILIEDSRGVRRPDPGRPRFYLRRDVGQGEEATMAAGAAHRFCAELLR